MTTATMVGPPATNDHGSQGGLSDDDHLIYLLLAGRAGGQTAVGGTALAERLNLRGSADAALGRVHVQSPMEIENVIAGDTVALRWRPTFTTGGAYIGGLMQTQADITYDNGLFIYSLLAEGGIFRAAAAPSFAAFTLFNATPRIINAGDFDLVQALVLNAGPSHERNTAGTSNTFGAVGLSFAPQARATILGAIMTYTNGMTAVSCAPTFSTVAFSVVNLGTIIGLRCVAPAIGIFQTGAGTENMTAYYGVDFANITFASSGDKVVVRSAMTDATDRFFLQNNGGARSDFGGGNLFDCGFVQCLADNVGPSLGAAGGDVILNWNGSALEWDPLVGLDARWQPFSNYWRYDLPSAGGIQFDVENISFGTTAADPTSANYFAIFAGPNLRAPTVNGQYADVLWTAGGTIDVAGFTISDLSAFQINSVATILNGGTIDDSSTLFINTMASTNATRMQALRVLGRSRLDGLMTHNSSTLTQLTASLAQLTLPANNLGRYVLLQDADALGPWTIQGILNVQVGDAFYIVNNGANSFLLGHQDGAAAAADRIISPTGANLTLAQDEMAKLWYDVAATRWRILETTGS